MGEKNVGCNNKSKLVSQKWAETSSKIRCLKKSDLH